MALKALMLRKKIDDKKQELSALRLKDAEFQTREAALASDIQAAQTDEERQTVESAVDTFESDKQAHADAKAALEREIGDLENDLKAEEDKQKSAQQPKQEERKENVRMSMKRFRDMSMQEQQSFIARDDVKNWLQRTRELGAQRRDISGKELLIPEIVLPMIHAETEEYSKLMQHVDMIDIPGIARQVIMGEVPEGIWTETYGVINEVGLSFTDIEIDGFKVGAFIPVCNALLEDADIALASEIIRALGQGLGYAVDKAIAYGTGVKMPTGFATKIETKISLAGKKGIELFKALVANTAALEHELGDLVWIMKKSTKATIVSESLSFNAAGAVVAGINNEMPVVGGTIVTEDFVADNEILVGYGKRYKLGRRAGISIDRSREYRFVEDQTVFKATARYDGKPVFEDAFMAFGLAGAPTAQLDPKHPFPQDKANTKTPAGNGDDN
ncbi:MAG: phage major capsid protein [Clostridia bacterium]|nr:phage major capsid protein [Clostridia bacterium]